jgi:cell division protease FtsH
MALGNQWNRTFGNSNSRSPWIGVGLLFLLAGLLFFSTTNAPRSSEEVPYSQFLTQVENGRVQTATIDDQRIRYTLRPEGEESAEEGEQQRFTVAMQPDSELSQKLRENGVEFSIVPPQEGGWVEGVLSLLGWLILPLLLFGFWSFLIRRAQQGGAMGGGQSPFGIGESKVRFHEEGETKTRFSDIAGVDEAKAELQEMVDYLSDREKYSRLGAQAPKGVLLVGPPGTGKTLLARAVAGEANVPFLSISGSEFIELFVGVGASRVRDLFAKAKEKAPCIVFIDELDALGKSRGGQGQLAGGGFNEQEQTLNQLLNEMDGFDPKEGVMVLGATNRPEVLDPALQRPGRFDRQITVDRPDKQGRLAILKVHTPSIKVAEDVDLEAVATRTPGFTGADLANLVNEAALQAARRGADRVILDDFQNALERVVAGLERKSRVLSDAEKQIVAYHESGHAIVGSLMPGAGRVAKISIVPRSVGALGFTLQLPEEEHFLVGEDEMRGRMVTMLAGRAAEELIFGKASTGASDDIQKVTDLAERFITLYGMSEKLGTIAFERPEQQFLQGMGRPRRSLSPQVEELIDQEIKRLVDTAHQVALQILDQNADLLDDTAQSLLEAEMLEADDLRDRLQQVQAPAYLQAWLKTGEQVINPDSEEIGPGDHPVAHLNGGQPTQTPTS